MLLPLNMLQAISVVKVKREASHNFVGSAAYKPYRIRIFVFIVLLLPSLNVGLAGSSCTKAPYSQHKIKMPQPGRSALTFLSRTLTSVAMPETRRKLLLTWAIWKLDQAPSTIPNNSRISSKLTAMKLSTAPPGAASLHYAALSPTEGHLEEKDGRRPGGVNTTAAPRGKGDDRTMDEVIIPPA